MRVVLKGVFAGARNKAAQAENEGRAQVLGQVLGGIEEA
jgi:hypothetical protein